MLAYAIGGSEVFFWVLVVYVCLGIVVRIKQLF